MSFIQEHNDNLEKFIKDRLIRIESKLTRFVLAWEEQDKRIKRLEESFADFKAEWDAEAEDHQDSRYPADGPCRSGTPERTHQ